MKRISLLFAAACLLQAAAPPRVIMSFTDELPNGILVRFSTVIDPPLKDSQLRMLNGGVSRTNDRIHRSMFDKIGQVYFGYNLGVERTGESNRLRVIIEPLTGEPQPLRANGGDPPPRLAPLPKYPTPQIIEDGDTIALDLLVSPDGSQKLVDYIHISSRIEPPPTRSVVSARDFTLDDGPLALNFTHPTRMWINGQSFEGRVAFTVMRSGGTIWFAIPNRGRYILSLAPHDGFQKAGAIRDNVLKFQAGGDQYEYRASAPILGAGAAWNLYMLHDPLFQPKATPSPTVFGGVDRMENLLPKE